MIQDTRSSWLAFAGQIRRKRNASILATAIAAAGAGSSISSGASILPGNLVIYRVGDGTAALGVNATAVFLDEYTPGGTFVQSIPLPTTGAAALTAQGSAATEGIVSLSQNGSSLVFTGYRKDVGGVNPVSDAPATTNRVIATVGLSGVVDTSIALTDPIGTIRSATTVDGSSYYFTTASSVRYAASPGPSTTSTVIDARNSRQVNLSKDILYAANGSTAITSKVQHYGVLPTGTTAPSPVVTLATGDAVNSFAIFDLNSEEPGDDTVYATSTVANQLLKFTLQAGLWSLTNSISASTAQNVTGVLSGGSVNLFLTSGTSLFSFTDSSGYNGFLTGALSSIATAGTNTGFRGLGLISVPEPSSLGLCLVAGAWGLAARRRKPALL
jgi:hypothetical protein